MPRSKSHSQQIRAESQEQILSTARHLFAERGYDGCRVSDIARQADMSHGNIYWYFSSKEEILQAVLADGFETLGSMMAQVAAQENGALEKLDNLLKSYIAFSRERGGNEFSTLLITLTAHGGVELLKELGFYTRQIGAGYHQSLATILAQAQAEGTVASETDPQLLTMFFFSFFNGLVIIYGKDWMNVPEELIQEAVIRLLGGKAP
jgi:AcrR family transcriptional regulator